MRRKVVLPEPVGPSKDVTARAGKSRLTWFEHSFGAETQGEVHCPHGRSSDISINGTSLGAELFRCINLRCYLVTSQPGSTAADLCAYSKATLSHRPSSSFVYSRWVHTFVAEQRRTPMADMVPRLGSTRWRSGSVRRPDSSEEFVKFTRSGAALSLLVAGALVLSGCGSNTNTLVGSSPRRCNCGGKKKLKASGATAQENAMEQFVYAYVHACPGYTLDYNANGSGAGVTDFVNNQTDLAGSGDPLNPSKGQPDRAAQRCGSPAWDLPAVFEPIAVTYHINGVSSLKLDGPTTAKIFNGSITTWNDPAITALNAGHQPARDAHSRHLPQRPIRQLIQLPAIPRCRIQRCVG